jgi:hypothetical protein
LTPPHVKEYIFSTRLKLPAGLGTKEGDLGRYRFLTLVFAVSVVVAYSAWPVSATSSTDPGVGNIPQGTQSNDAYANSFANKGVTNVDATSGPVSCYRPEVSAAAFNDGSPVPNDGYSGESPCPATGATTGENTGASAKYPTQAGSNPGYPMSSPQLVKDHSESDIRVDPTNPNHLIGSSKWFVSPEGYNHVLGFYESFDGGATWPVQGHIPGYEGWTDNTDPVGAFDSNGNYYEFILAYQFYYNSNGSHNFNIGTPQEPNPAEPAEVVSVAVRPHGATTADDWITTHNNKPDIAASYDSIGNEPDKQWMTIDTNKTLPDGSPNPNFDNVYLMWVDFHFLTPLPFVSVAHANADGTHTDWSAPIALPLAPHSPQGATYLLPHVTPDGNVFTSITNFNPKKGFCCTTIFVDESQDGGKTWSVVGTAVPSATPPPLIYPNTTFRDGIENTFTVGSHLDSKGAYPLYVAYEDFSAGVDNVLLTASFDGGATWTTPIQVNDNVSPVDEFQPNLTTASDGTISVAFYDRRLPCPAADTPEAANAGIALDQAAQNPHYTGPVPPYGEANYCVNASIQFYNPTLSPPYSHNIRLTQFTWDPQLNAAHPGSAGGEETFIGDYYGNIANGTMDVTSFASSYNYGSNPNNQQQQIVAKVAIP